MEWLFVLAGIALILAGVTDVFFTVLHYDGFGFLSSRLYASLFDAVWFVTRPLPRKYRDLGLSLAAPAMIPMTISAWILLVALGYALLYYAGMSQGNFTLASGLEPSFGSALYVSGVSISTLGFGDVTPKGSVYQALTISEALVGFGILTLSVTYVLGIYGVLQQLGILSAGLYHQAHDSSDPLSILAPHFPEGQHRGLETHTMQLHRGLVEIYEGIRRYPIVYYYHSRRAYRSLPYTFRMVGGMAAALRWGLPKDHPGSQTPWLSTLVTGFETIVTYLDERFLSETIESPPDPVPYETFEAAYSRGKAPNDPWLECFIHINSHMAELARLDDRQDPEEAYERYREWLPFAHRDQAFFEASARDLGYDLEELNQRPGERLF